jgi:hypothetical protein
MKLLTYGNLTLGLLIIITTLHVVGHLRMTVPYYRRPHAPAVVSNHSAKPKICVVTAVTARGDRVSTHLVRSVAATCEFERFEYAVHLAYDSNDPHFVHEGNRSAYAAHAAPVPVHWLAVVNEKHKPGPPFNAISAHAVASGCAWIYRSNDDVKLKRDMWSSKFVAAIESFDSAGVGVVGPTCHQGNSQILTTDFTSATHDRIFGWRYPPPLSDWWLDDWITHVYGRARTRKLADVEVIHHLTPTRYDVTYSNEALLDGELRKGEAVLARYLAALSDGGAVVEPEDSAILRNGRRVSLTDLQSPLYVVFANAAFGSILQNFLCDTRHMLRFQVSTAPLWSLFGPSLWPR